MFVVFLFFKSAARELCAPLQNKIVTKGVARTIKGEKIYALADYGYGKPHGCLGIDCGHYLTPYIVGLNYKPDLPEELKELDEKQAIKNANAQAKQRAFEREIRKSKELINISKIVNDKELEQKHRLRIKTLRSGLKQHIENNPFLYRDKVRERVGKKHLTKVGKSAKIKETSVKAEYMRNNLDSMAKHQRFSTENALKEEISFKAKKDETTEYDIWLQKNGKKDRDTLELLKKELSNFDNIPRIVIVDHKKLKGIAGYDYVQDILFVSNILNSKESIDEVLSDGYFASINLNDILKHELTHKKHWDSARKLYNRKKKQYNNVKDAKADLDLSLQSYVNRQNSTDFNFVYNISENAGIAYDKGNINELVAEVMVLGDRTPDKNLLNKVKEVLGYGSNGKTK